MALQGLNNAPSKAAVKRLLQYGDVISSADPRAVKTTRAERTKEMFK